MGASMLRHWTSGHLLFGLLLVLVQTSTISPAGVVAAAGDAAKPKVPDPSLKIQELAKEAVSMGQFQGEHETAEHKPGKPDVVAKTLDGLGQVRVVWARAGPTAPQPHPGAPPHVRPGAV